MGIDPARTFMPSVFWSWILAAPILLALGLAASMTSSLLYLASPLSQARITPTFFLNDFPTYFSLPTVSSMTARGVIMAGGSALIAYGCGSTPKRSSNEVMQGMTRALVLSFVWLAFVDMFFGILFPF
jgi:ABC-type transporter Mla maintaining outer membrane lipid asymmetry permease subunit MlaE